MHADGQTDMTKLIGAFLDCVKRFKQRISKFCILQSAAHSCTSICIPLSDTFGCSWKWRVVDFPCAYTGGVQKPIHPQNLDLIPANDMTSWSDTRHKLN